MVKHTSTYQIPLDPLFLRKKKSCDPLFHLALFHFRRILDRRGSWWEKCCECFKTFFSHQSRTKWRSTHVKATLYRVGWVWVGRKWFSNVPSVEDGTCTLPVSAVISNLWDILPLVRLLLFDQLQVKSVECSTQGNSTNGYGHVAMVHEHVWARSSAVFVRRARVLPSPW